VSGWKIVMLPRSCTVRRNAETGAELKQRRGLCSRPVVILPAIARIQAPEIAARRKHANYGQKCCQEAFLRSHASDDASGAKRAIDIADGSNVGLPSVTHAATASLVRAR
jgi:hypothetical protein